MYFILKIFCNLTGTEFHIHIILSFKESWVYNGRKNSGLVIWLFFFKLLVVSTMEKNAWWKTRTVKKLIPFSQKNSEKNPKELLCTVNDFPEMKWLFTTTTNKCCSCLFHSSTTVHFQRTHRHFTFIFLWPLECQKKDFGIRFESVIIQSISFSTEKNDFTCG